MYYRVSTQGQKTDDTIIIQKQIGRAWLISKGITDYREYEDDGISGTKGKDDRAGLFELLSDIEAGKVDSVWAKEQSRFIRDDDLYGSIFLVFKKYNIKVFIRDNSPLDLNKPIDIFTSKIISAKDALEIDIIKERMQDGVRRSKDAGTFGYKRMYGYQKSHRNDSGRFVFVPNEEEQHKIRMMYDLVLSGMSVRQAYRELISSIFGQSQVDEYLKSGRDKQSYWYARLRNPRFAGYDFDSKNNLVESKIYTSRIITLDEYYRMQGILTDNKLAPKTKVFNSAKYSATGMIKCHYCKVSYYFMDGRGVPYYYHWRSTVPNSQCCSKKTLSKDLIDIILKYIYIRYYMIQLFYKIFKPENNPLIRQQQIDNTNLVNLENEYSTYEKEKKRLNRIIVENSELAGEEEYISQVKKIINRMQFIKKSIENIKSNLERKQYKIEEIMDADEAESIVEISSGDEAKVNTLLRSFFNRVVIYNDVLYISTYLGSVYCINIGKLKAKDLNSWSMIIDAIRMRGAKSNLLNRMIVDSAKAGIKIETPPKYIVNRDLLDQVYSSIKADSYLFQADNIEEVLDLDDYENRLNLQNQLIDGFIKDYDNNLPQISTTLNM